MTNIKDLKNILLNFMNKLKALTIRPTECHNVIPLVPAALA